MSKPTTHTIVIRDSFSAVERRLGCRVLSRAIVVCGIKEAPNVYFSIRTGRPLGAWSHRSWKAKLETLRENRALVEQDASAGAGGAS